MNFSFATATRIVFGPGTISDVGELIKPLGKRLLVVGGGSPSRLEPLVSQLDPTSYALFAVVNEPVIGQIVQGVAAARSHGADMVVAMGGGSVIDAGKAISALVPNPGHPLDYIEVIGQGRFLQHAPLPFVAIPTTAGTGAEVTKNAVINSPVHRRKVSLRSEKMFPTVALVDPELTLTMPPNLTAFTGLDALTQCIEPYLSRMSNPLSDALAVAGIKRAARSLRKAVSNGENLVAREDMAFASLMGGLALANAKLGAVHGFAGVLGGELNCPHGAICGRLLPEVFRVNYSSLVAEASPTGPMLARFKEISVWLTDDPAATVTDGMMWLEKLVNDLAVPGLGEYGLTDQKIPDMVEKSKRSSSMKGNPVLLSDQALTEILNRSL